MIKMSTKFSSFLLFALLLAHREMIMLGEAAVCQTPSRLFRGMCISRSNCTAICEKEGYKFGTCKHFKCICTTNCSGGGGGEVPPGGGEQIPPGEDVGEGPPGGDGGDEQGGDGGDGGQGGDGEGSTGPRN